MKHLADNTNLWWTGFYLTPAPSQGHSLGWMGAYNELKDQGWGFAPIFVGQQEQRIPHCSHILTEAQGEKDAQTAADLARTAHFPHGSVIYLDFEFGLPLSEEVKTYCRAWSNALVINGYYPGVYCSWQLAGPLVSDSHAKTTTRPVIWAVNYSYPKKRYKVPYPEPDPRDSGVASASLWQLRGNVWIEYKDDMGLTRTQWADLDTSVWKDPSRRDR
jgi:hypothetical protein